MFIASLIRISLQLKNLYNEKLLLYVQLQRGVPGAAGPAVAARVREASDRGGGPVRMATPVPEQTLRTRIATPTYPAAQIVRTT